MTEKKTKSKVGGTTIRRARKPSIIAIIVLGLLSLGAAAWLIYQSFAASTVTVRVIDTRTGQPVANADVRIRSTDGQRYCNTPYSLTNSQGYTTFVNCIVRSTGDTYSYYYIGLPAGWTASPPASLLLVNGVNYTFQLNVTSPTPPTPSGCGGGTLNDQCASIQSFSVNPSSPVYAQSVNISWTSSWTSGCTLSTPQNGSSQPANGNITYGPVTTSGTYTLICNPSVGGATAGRQATVSVFPPPSITGFGGSTSIAYDATTTLSWSSSNASGCSLTGGTSAPGNVGTSGTWTSPKLKASTTYSLQCSNAAGYKTAAQNKGISVAGQPPPPLKDGCGAGTKNNTCPPGGGGGGGGSTSTSKPPTVVANNTAPASSGDNQRPSAPGNLKAEESSGAVDLSWDASTDGSGIAAYIVERSTDNKTWETLNDGVTDTSYTDSDANFSTLYYYRVSAKDNNGNISDYAVTEITTGDFAANAFKDSDSTITSEDGVVVAKIPAGALSEDAACEIVIDEESQQALGKKKLLHGPYKLVCKKKDGTTFEKFDKPIIYELNISDEAKKQNPALYGFADNQWTNSNIAYSKDAPNFTFESDIPAPFAVLSESSFPWMWLILLLLLIAVLVAAFIWWRKRNSDGGTYVGSGYNPSTMYNDSTASNTPAAAPGEMTIPSSSAPESSQAPGQHQIDVKPTPVHNPALEHHSPLDRLNEMETADTKADIPGDLTAPGDTSAGGVEPKDPGK